MAHIHLIKIQGKRDTGINIGFCRLRARLLQPPALFPNMKGRNIELRAILEGQFATAAFDYRLTADRFAARNLFPVGRITEDPATGSAAAALGAYLRDLRAVEVPGRITIEQGAHVGRPGLLAVDIPATGGIRVSGAAVPLTAMR